MKRKQWSFEVAVVASPQARVGTYATVNDGVNGAARLFGDGALLLASRLGCPGKGIVTITSGRLARLSIRDYVLERVLLRPDPRYLLGRHLVRHFVMYTEGTLMVRLCRTEARRIFGYLPKRLSVQIRRVEE